ncbi:MAG: hypothetical protein K9G83_01145, partial [Hyphomonadaceae bacterium]|nr:hypothetical protein [Hyphomonadaceae bacterium]
TQTPLREPLGSRPLLLHLGFAFALGRFGFSQKHAPGWPISDAQQRTAIEPVMSGSYTPASNRAP